MDTFIEDFDNPLYYYKFLFPDDEKAESKIKQLMIDAGNKHLHMNLESVEDFEKRGVSKHDLDIYCLVELQKEYE